MTTNHTPDEKEQVDRVTSGDVVSQERVEQLAHTFREQGTPFARVIVVRREPPVSANVGDRALITPEGDVLGWIGGVECTQSTIVREALSSIESGTSKLVGLAPDPDEIARPGLETFQMTCHSGGTLEVFIEAVTPLPQLLIVGSSPIAAALSRLAGELAFDVIVVDPDAGDYPTADVVLRNTDSSDLDAAITGPPFVVIASMGDYDVLGVVSGIEIDALYIGLVASDRRAAEVIDRAADQLGIDTESVRTAVTNPAGVHIDAKTPEEIAVSVLAEVIDVKHELDVSSQAIVTPDPVETAVDPVCGMEVSTDDSPTVEYAGDTYYFCCSGCADSFDENPDEYVQTV